EGLLVLVGSLERVASDEVSSEVSVPVVRSEDSAANLAVAWADLTGALEATVVREASAASEELAAVLLALEVPEVLVPKVDLARLKHVRTQVHIPEGVRLHQQNPSVLPAKAAIAPDVLYPETATSLAPDVEQLVCSTTALNIVFQLCIAIFLFHSLVTLSTISAFVTPSNGLIHVASSDSITPNE
ncbi:hypothetical protein PC115_g20337, partial [Phytophthora cactorum]